jgi:hypothetical protein
MSFGIHWHSPFFKLPSLPDAAMQLEVSGNHWHTRLTTRIRKSFCELLKLLALDFSSDLLTIKLLDSLQSLCKCPKLTQVGAWVLKIVRN